MSRKYLEGRIVDCGRQFAALSPELQEETKACEQYLIQKKDDVFAMHHASPFRTVYSVRGRLLLETIEGWLLEKKKVVDEEDGAAVEVVAQPTRSTSVEDVPAGDMTVEELGPPMVDAIPSTSLDELTTHQDLAKLVLDELKTRRDHAKVVMEALTLNGFVTLHKESNDAFVYKDFDLYVPLSKQVIELPFNSVWEAMEGAVFAAPMKRKAGLFAPFTQGKEIYLVVNDKHKTIYLFESDCVPSPPIVVFGTVESSVCYDTSHFTHGIKVWDTDSTELLNARSKLEQDWLVHAMVVLGVQYVETATIDRRLMASLYAHDEKDLEGKDVALAQYKGKVVLIVNVASQCASALLHFSELSALDAKYRSDGLVILGCPCNQFGGLEFGSAPDIQAFVERLDAGFALLEPRDVHGMEARPLFTYLNKKLPGPYGPFVEWNFTKFVVDRSGQPFQRFTPEETPLSFEPVIVELLQQDAPVDDVVDARVAALDAANGVVETVDAATAVAAVATRADVADAEPKVVDEAAQLLKEENLEEEDLEEVDAEEEGSGRGMPISTMKQPLHGEEMGPTALYS